MIISTIVILISFILDGVLSNFLPYLVGNLSLFTPMFTIVSLILIYPFFQKRIKNYFIIAFVLGTLYDLFYTNLLLFNAILFLAVAVLIMYLYKYVEMNYINIILYVVLIITVYELLTVFCIVLFQLVPISFAKVIYKISHSLILNIIYVEIIYFIINMIPKKYKKISIN